METFINIDVITSRYIQRLWKIEALAESSSVYIVITSVWLGGFLSPKCLHYGENISVSFNLDLVLRYPQVRCILIIIFGIYTRCQ